jgi:hypothetical protein
MLMLMEALRFASWPSLPSRRDSSSPRYAPTRRGDVPEQSRHAFAVRSEGEGKFVTGKLAVMAVRMAITCRVGGTNFLRDLAPTRWATYRWSREPAFTVNGIVRGCSRVSDYDEERSSEESLWDSRERREEQDFAEDRELGKTAERKLKILRNDAVSCRAEKRKNKIKEGKRDVTRQRAIRALISQILGASPFPGPSSLRARIDVYVNCGAHCSYLINYRRKRLT